MITSENVKNWIGSEASVDDYVNIIKDVANGKYKPEVLKDNIESYEA